ncbi:MAG TPA: hypothetical protein PLU37_09480 [Chitinophagaceae bacterium]|nr:hypothetical protein [Chitinophagaceae bacterium]MCB9055308.1 hypothetical protein [Chitinophagales bacterium]HPG11749.1 hypothetical protein [Chitinophagaceae bacterium]
MLVLEITGIVMPYNNFNDTYIYKVFSDCKEQDPDLDINEFVFEKLLVIGTVLEHNDEEDEENTQNSHNRIPSEAIPTHIQPGTIILNAAQFATQKNTIDPKKPLCFFKENKYSFNYLSSIFHPPLYSI